jgi:peptide chain release factor subunit 1
VFADSLDDLWVTLPLAEVVRDTIKIDRACHVAPLVSLVGVGDGALVAVVGREAGDIYRLRGGRLEQVVDQTEEQPSRHDQGGWSQARFQRHIDNLAAEHMRAVAAELDRHVRRLDNPAVVVVATEENRGEFEEMVAQETRAALAGWVQAEAHATPAQLLDVVAPVLDESRARRQEEVLARWREEAGRDGRAASGWAATLEAASDSRVDVLLFHEGAQREAWQCPSCGRAAADAGRCPLDGVELERRDDGLDLAIRHAFANGGRALAITGPDLDPVEGIGAILRF